MKPPGSVSVARAPPTGWAPASLIGNTVKASVLGALHGSWWSEVRRVGETLRARGLLGWVLSKHNIRARTTSRDRDYGLAS